MRKITFIEFILSGLLGFILLFFICPNMIQKIYATGMEIKANTTGVVYIHFLNASNTTAGGITGLTNTTTNFYYSINDGTLTAFATPVTLTELNSTLDPGTYALNYTTTQTATLGNLLIKGNASGAVPFRDYYNIVANIESDAVTYESAINATVNHATYGNSAIKTNLGGLTNVTLAATQTGVTIPTVTIVTNDVGITQAGADKAWGTTTRQLTGTQTFNNTGNILGNVTNVTNPVTLNATLAY